jgi:hypothetical protein
MSKVDFFPAHKYGIQCTYCQVIIMLHYQQVYPNAISRPLLLHKIIIQTDLNNGLLHLRDVQLNVRIHLQEFVM